MKKVSHILVAFVLVAVVSVILFMPTGKANTNGFFVLTFDEETIDSYFENAKLKKEIVDTINSQSDNAPEQLFELFGNNKINIYITLDDNSVSEYYATTNKNKLKELRKGAKKSADIEVRLTESTINSIVLSEQPLKEFLDSMQSGKIKYKGLNFDGEVKSASVAVSTTILSVIIGVVGFFTGSFS